MCPNYNAIRTVVFGSVISNNPFNTMADNEQLVFLVNNNQNKVIEFTKQAYLLSRDLLYNRS
jgi:hypothetical protein